MNQDDSEEKEEIHFQFFTTDQGLIHGTWFPMDHFFYAPSVHSSNGGFVEEGVVVWMEAHANIRHPNGWSVSILHGDGDGSTSEEYDDYPSALRRMADIIEAHTNKTTVEPDAWNSQDDRSIPEDAAISAAFPTRSGRHDLYAKASRLVGAKYTKGALIALVNWLLHLGEASERK